MKNVIKLEESGMFLLSIWLFALTDFPWWYYLAFLLAPDISMLGYVINNKAGALSYNFFHHKGTAIVVYILGIYFNQPWVEFAGIIMFGHSSMDRILGYGLKYADHFKHTNLGWLKLKPNEQSTN